MLVQRLPLKPQPVVLLSAFGWPHLHLLGISSSPWSPGAVPIIHACTCSNSAGCDSLVNNVVAGLYRVGKWI
jgi:hypothetical protein